MKKNLPENKPTQWEIGQPSDVFSKNPVKIKIPLGLLQRGVLAQLGLYSSYFQFSTCIAKKLSVLFMCFLIHITICEIPFGACILFCLGVQARNLVGGALSVAYTFIP